MVHSAVIHPGHTSVASPDAVVHAFTRVGRRPCERPACVAPAIATLRFAYDRREAWLDALVDDPDPQSYDLCAQHLSRTRAPQGWKLKDRRPDGERHTDAPPATPADLGGERTVAVLAAALRATGTSAPESGREPARIERPRTGAGVAAPGGGGGAGG
ncbi:MAG: DUF3499 family protein, partial [Nitriliruptoraceae bacterium]